MNVLGIEYGDGISTLDALPYPTDPKWSIGTV